MNQGRNDKLDSLKVKRDGLCNMYNCNMYNVHPILFIGRSCFIPTYARL
jgi:hypothetical protein